MSIETVVSGYTQPPRRTWTEKVRDFYWSYKVDFDSIAFIAVCVVLSVGITLALLEALMAFGA